eukprot:3573904-Rhodomonas_salina.2
MHDKPRDISSILHKEASCPSLGPSLVFVGHEADALALAESRKSSRDQHSIPIELSAPRAAPNIAALLRFCVAIHCCDGESYRVLTAEGPLRDAHAPCPHDAVCQTDLAFLLPVGIPESIPGLVLADIKHCIGHTPHDHHRHRPERRAVHHAADTQALNSRGAFLRAVQKALFCVGLGRVQRLKSVHDLGDEGRLQQLPAHHVSQERASVRIAKHATSSMKCQSNEGCHRSVRENQTGRERALVEAGREACCVGVGERRVCEIPEFLPARGASDIRQHEVAIEATELGRQRSIPSLATRPR